MQRFLVVLPTLLILTAIIGFSGVEEDVKKGLIILCIIATFWISEVIPLSITSLLVPVLAVVLGLMDVKKAFSSFAHPIIFLFLGGFVLATALSKYEIDRFVAYKMARLSGNSFIMSSFMLMIATAFTSMWISNTSTTAMMLPLAIGMLKSTENMPERNYTFLLLGIAYSASIGGMGTLVGSPPNGIAAGILNISFSEWLKFGVIFVMLLLPILFIVLFYIFKPISIKVSIKEKVKLKVGVKEIGVLSIFILTILGWLFSKKISSFLGIGKYMDSIIAVIAIILLTSLKLVSWHDIKEKTDWGTLYLFGGGLALSEVLKISGSADFLSSRIALFTENLSHLLIVLTLTLFIIFMTELMSNTATTAIFAPILMSTAITLNIPPTELIIPIALASSCAFMLPVATPPNAIVYGTGFIKQKFMLRAGILLNILLGSTIAIFSLFIL